MAQVSAVNTAVPAKAEAQIQLRCWALRADFALQDLDPGLRRGNGTEWAGLTAAS